MTKDGASYRAEELLERFELADAVNCPVSTYSEVCAAGQAWR
ncbi:MAG: hypothetical protein R2789_11545 [Microthrixaceae bacterium]